MAEVDVNFELGCDCGCDSVSIVASNFSNVPSCGIDTLVFNSSHFDANC